MSKIELILKNGNFGFDAYDENGHIIKMDTSSSNDGQNYGVRPMEMVLMGLAGCSAIDVITILRKQRQEIIDYKMIINGFRDPNKEPSIWKDINIEFYLYGNINYDKAIKAVDLSINKYCSVASILFASGSNIKYNVIII